MPVSANRQFALDQSHRLLKRFSAQLKKTLRAPVPDTIHDLRVAIRRFDQILATYKEWLDQRKVKTMRGRLKTLFSTAGEARDCDIAIELLAKAGTDDVSKIADELHLRRREAEHRLTASVRRLIRQKATAQWRAGLAAMKPPPEAVELTWEDLARQEVPRRAKNFFKSGNRAERKGAPDELHKFRIAAKKFRYTFELFESAYGPTAESRLDSLRKVQNTLGDINDLQTARKLVDELGGAKELDAVLRKKQRKKVAEFRNLWAAEFPPSEVKEWMRFLRRPLRKPMARSESAQHAAEQVQAAR